MYKIAICDDERDYHETIKRIFMEEKEFLESTAFYEYFTGKELVDNIWQQHDLIFLDIQMPGMNGNEAATLLREVNRDAVLVFCTNCISPTPEFFKVRPYRYIMKDLKHKMLRAEMKDILKEMMQKSDWKYLDVAGDGKVQRIPIKSILYISVIKRGAAIFIYPDNGITQINCRESLKELYAKLADDGFVYAHSSYIVNMSNIIGVQKTLLILKNRTELTISRSKKAHFDEKFSQFLHKRYKRGGKIEL